MPKVYIIHITGMRIKLNYSKYLNKYVLFEIQNCNTIKRILTNGEIGAFHLIDDRLLHIAIYIRMYVPRTCLNKTK